MLPLHTAIKSIAFALFSFIIFNSCSNHSKNNIEIIRALNESIEISNKMLSISIMDEMISLRNKLDEPGSAERAKIWYSRTERIQQLSKDIYDYIENTKQNIRNSTINTPELFEKLKKYQQEILQVDPKITNEFQKSLKIYTQLIDSSKNDRAKLFKNYFKNVPFESMIAMLNKLENNIAINELRITTFCNEHVGSMGDYWPAVQYVLILNTTLARPKESIEFTAGMLSFQKQRTSEVFVYGKKVELTDDAFVHYKFKAASKPGKHYVPVKINYTGLDGKQQTIEKEVEYTVANIQKQ